MSLVIKRSDGLFYAGTADKKAIWTQIKEAAAHFRDRAVADVRIKGLVAAEPDETFEIEGAE